MSPPDVTALLRSWRNGDRDALDRMIPLVYGELRDIAGRLMRRVLVDHAKARGRVKRGGGRERLTLEESIIVAPGQTGELLDLDDALSRLEQIDERKARVIELHYFGGLPYDETAEALGVSAATVDRDLRFANAWLYRELDPAARSEFLRGACGDDEALRSEVESLLVAGDRAGNFIDSAISDAQPPDAHRGIGPGTRLGPYRVVRELGRGGMGAVYLAERADDQYQVT